jgi:hypothetical protein
LHRISRRQWLHRGEEEGTALRMGVFCWLQEWGQEEGAVWEWSFLLVARVGKGRGRWARRGFCWLLDYNIYGQRNPFSHYWKKCSRKDYRVVFYNVRSILVKLIQIWPNLHLYIFI